MKPIIFQLDNVYEDFKRNGKIATFRKRYPDDTEFWIRRSRTGEKEFEAALMKVIRVNKGDPIPFRTIDKECPTGFRNGRYWVEKIQNMYNGVIPSGWILVMEKI